MNNDEISFIIFYVQNHLFDKMKISDYLIIELINKNLQNL